MINMQAIMQFLHSHAPMQICVSDRLDRASATETVDASSIPGQVKLKIIKVNIHSFPA